MTTYEQAWRDLDLEIEGQVRDLQRLCRETAAEIARDAPNAQAGGNAKLIAARAAHLVELRARLDDREELLARMRRTAERIAR